MSQFRSTQYTEVPGTPQESYGPGNAGCVRKIRVAWTARQQAVRDFLGYTQIESATSSTKYYNRTTPHQHPEWPQLYAESLVSSEPEVPAGVMGAGTGPVAAYDNVIQTYRYVAFDHVVLEDKDVQNPTTGFTDESLLLRYVWPRFQGSHRMQTLPPFATLYWANNPVDSPLVPVSNQIGILLGEADLTIELRGIPIIGVKWSTLYGLVGSCNNADLGNLNSLCGLQPKDTLLFLSGEWARQYKQSESWNGNRQDPKSYFVGDLLLKWHVYPQGVNQFYRWSKTTPGFQLATRDGTLGGPLTFPEKDHTVLFNPMN